MILRVQNAERRQQKRLFLYTRNSAKLQMGLRGWACACVVYMLFVNTWSHSSNNHVYLSIALILLFVMFSTYL